VIKKYEFWNPRLFEVPFYIYLGAQCLINRVGIIGLAKANYGLDHGEIGLGSKFDSQLAFDQRFFLPSVLIDESLSVDQKKDQIHAFVDLHGYPVILKSNVGSVGKGIVKISTSDDVDKHTPRLLGSYILQKFTTNPFECGVFYIRQNGMPKITGINKKHFPTVVGNGNDNVQVLAKRHPRYSKHWNSFLQDIDTSEVLELGVEKRLSFIGSHTLGCKFTDDADLHTAELEKAIFAVFETQAGFNFGRVDVKAADEEAFKRGEFVVIEVNGVASLPTHMFDPKYSVWQAYEIFFQHAKYLAKIASEQRHQPMGLLSYWQVLKKVNENQKVLNKVHQALMGNPE
jgi:hypothetical protein